MRKLTFIAFTFMLFGCKDVSKSTVKVVYANGDKDTLLMYGKMYLNEGCLYSTGNNYNVCGVRRFEIINKSK